MLEKLLEQVSQSGVVSVDKLASQFAVSRELVEGMIADLVRAGYLQQVGGCVQPRCRGCPEAGSCSTKTRVWTRVK